MGSTANSPNPSFKGCLHRGTLKLCVFSGRSWVCWCSGAGRVLHWVIWQKCSTAHEGQLCQPRTQSGFILRHVGAVKATHTPCPSTAKFYLCFFTPCGKVKYAGGVLFQPKATAKRVDKTHKHFNELFEIKVWKLQVISISCSFFFF